MTGNPLSEPPNLRFLLDESLIPIVAQALRLVGYDFVDIWAIPSGRGTQDPEIIDWCRENSAVWVHADDRAKKQHRVRLQTSRIQTLRIHRPHGGMTAKEQLRILAFVLPLLLEKITESPRVRHYRATAANPTAKPSLREEKI